MSDKDEKPPRVNSGHDLYEALLAVTEDYLGPAAQRFVDRQIGQHLAKSPGSLTRSDVSKLTEWSKISLGLLTEDDGLVEEFGKRLKEL